MIRKNKSNQKKTPEEMCLEDDVVGAVHVAEEEHVVVVSRSLTFYKLYEFIVGGIRSSARIRPCFHDSVDRVRLAESVSWSNTFLLL
jgi:hypothetical protein